MSLRIRSSAWLFFDKTSDPSIAKCSLCGSSIKSHNSTTNLLKHLRSRHFEETSSEINWESSGADNFDDQSSAIPSASDMSEEKYSGADDETEAAEGFAALEYADFHEEPDPTDSGTEVSSDAPTLLHDDLATMATVASDMALNLLSSQTDRRKTTRSLAWACFSRVSNSEVAICKYCRVVVKTESGSTSNMLNHFSRRHAKEFEEAKAKRVLNLEDSTEQTLGDIAYDDIGGPDDSLQDSSLCTADLTASELTERTNKSIVWSCFNRQSFNSDSGVHDCIHCGAHLRSDQGSTSSMLAHFMKKHPAEYRAAISSRSIKSGSKSSMIRKHFSQLTNDDWCCCYCQRLLRQTGSSTSNLVKHLMKKHREEYKIIFAELSPRSVVIKKEQVDDDIEEDDDCHTNGAYKDFEELPDQLFKRRKILSPAIPGFGESPLSKMTTLWSRHCSERHKEHDRQMSGMKEKLSTLQESMKKIRAEIASVQSEISRTEDAWRKETTRQKEVNRQFQIALKQAETTEQKGARASSSGSLAMDVDDSEVDKSF